MSALSDRAAQAALTALEAEGPSPALLDLAGRLAAEERDGDFGRLFTGLVLDRAAAALLLLLLAQASHEGLARRLVQAAPAGTGPGLPFWLAARLIPGLSPAHLAGGGALRRFGLVSLDPAAARVDALLQLTEPVLDRLLDCAGRDPELVARIRPFPDSGGHVDPALREELAAAFVTRDSAGLSQVAVFEQAEPAALAATLADMGLRPFRLPVDAIPADVAAAERLAAIWSRDAMLDRAALVVTLDHPEDNRAADFAARVLGHVVVVGPLRVSAMARGARVLPAVTASISALAARWAAALGPVRTRKLGPDLARIAAQFRLDAAEIEAVCAREAAAIDAARDGTAAGARLWHAAGRAAQAIAVPGLSIIEPAYRWDDIVLPPAIERSLRRLEGHVRHATTVMDDWGFARSIGGRGRGVVALLSGPSGTGKTMAAEVLASSLDLRMMVIDLSQIISKWVGETSKNVAACFRHAERSGAVMVWNEGDAIWGARGAVGSASDRHVNSEIGDLLQRMESFNGFSVVTTNMRHAVDTAFLRRFRFMIDFPMPSEAERLRIWQKAFPAEAPVEPLEWATLAALPLSGGSIRNVALGSAFQVAERGGRIDAAAVAAELAEELRKQDLPMPVLDWGTRQ